MALPVKDQMKYWGVAAAVFMIALWWLGDVILPFVLGGAVAYFLDPVADRLEAAGASRALATAIITLFGVLIFVVLALLVVPTLINQAVQLFDTVPKVFQDFQAFLTARFPDLLDEGSTLRQSLTSVAETIQSKGGQLLETALTSVGSLINVVMLFVIVPVVAFYLLYDWDRMGAQIDNLLPRDHAPVIRKLAREIDQTLASFIRGMGTVCLILGSYYAVALMLVGLQFGLVVGAFAGLITFIPYVGALLGGALAIGLALFQFWGDWVSIGLVAGISVRLRGDAGCGACRCGHRRADALRDLAVQGQPAVSRAGHGWATAIRPGRKLCAGPGARLTDDRSASPETSPSAGAGS